MSTIQTQTQLNTLAMYQAISIYTECILPSLCLLHYYWQVRIIVYGRDYI